MPRNATVTADGAVEAIRQAEGPFASTGTLADHFGVTRQAVRSRREQLAADPRIEMGTVSNNTVFYLAEEEKREPADGPPSRPLEREGARESEDTAEEDTTNVEGEAGDDNPHEDGVEVMGVSRAVLMAGASGATMATVALALTAIAYSVWSVLGVSLSPAVYTLALEAFVISAPVTVALILLLHTGLPERLDKLLVRGGVARTTLEVSIGHEQP